MLGLSLMALGSLSWPPLASRNIRGRPASYHGRQSAGKARDGQISQRFCGVRIVFAVSRRLVPDLLYALVVYTLLVLKTGRTFAELSARRGDFEDWFFAHLSANR